ncbi:uncharacterized protein LOC134177551 [Corticium candelabrum]|uniref:uncharacterized protein LOC134177551 n=1 Tax=Corticium candelabrum TaxID=121492 RepID=UPI002E2724F8|nr:uncharacterized protein LOC134177551 [Corticium candelabrum]
MGTFRRRTSEEHLYAETPIDQSHTLEHTSHTLPDIITEAAAQKPIDATSDKIDADVQPTETVNKEIHEMPIYACVNKKKSVRDPQENIKPTPSVAVPHSSAYVPICIPPSPKVNTPPTTEKAPEEIRVKDTNSNTSPIDGTQNKPQRPVPFGLYKSKKEKSEKDDSKKLEKQDLQTKEDAKKDSHQDTGQRSDQITAKDTSQEPSQSTEKDTDQDSTVLYAQLMKPKPKKYDATEKADSRSKHSIQYVELDLSALNKKL